MKRPNTPRIPPMDLAAMSDTQRTLAGIGASNVLGTLVRHEDLLKAWLGLAQKLLLSGRVSPRDRELAILRVALRTDCEYEWANHVSGAVAASITIDEIRALADPASAAWSDPDTALLRAVDELCADDCVSDDTWAALAATRDDLQLIEILCLIGYYRMNAGLLNSMSTASPNRPPALGPSATTGNGPTGIGGNWRVIFHHPTGDQQLALALHSCQGAISGSVTNPALGMTVESLRGPLTVATSRSVRR